MAAPEAPAPKPIPFTQFGGLVLNKPLDEVGSDNAIDLLDVDWPGSGGALKSRQGAEAFTGAAAANYDALFPHSDERLLARRGTTLVVVKLSDGTEVAGKTAAVSAKHLSLTRLGTPAASYSYIADQENTIKRFDGSDFTEPTVSVDGEGGKAALKGRYLATWIDEGNRLVIAGTEANGGPGGAGSSGSHVWFAEPGNAEGYESTAFVQLNPGDGEDIVDVVAWGGQIFVFKETRLFLFYGISPDAEGKPIFNFRSIDLGTRILRPAAKTGSPIAAGGEGVYFVANDGLWVTTGGEPSLLSEDLEPLASSEDLIGPAAETFGSKRWTDVKGVEVKGNAVYVGLGEETVELLLKFDLRGLRWTVWKAALNCFVTWIEDVTSKRSRLYFSGSSAGAKRIYFYTPAAEDDETVEMDPAWQSGFYELEDADEKTLVWLKAWGTGEIEVKVAEDYGTLGDATVIKLGDSPAIAQRQIQKGQSATLFSHRLSGKGPWSLQRIDRYLRETRVPETER